MQSTLMKRIDKVIKRMMLEDSDRNKTVNYLVFNYILSLIESEFVMQNTDPCRNMGLLINAAYICVTYDYFLRGYRRFWVDFNNFIHRIHIGKYESQDPLVIVSVMGIFKGEYRDHMHMLPLMNVTQS